MERMRTQITALTTKVDHMSQNLEQLNHKISLILSDLSLYSAHKVQSEVKHSGIDIYLDREDHRLHSFMDHKDVLVDDHCSETVDLSFDLDLSPEIQIQRLTAQLTAAYHRIAALEEQLLSQRIH